MSWNEDRTVEAHESYGAITINRTSGRTHLFGSDAEHSHFVHIEVRHAEMHRDLSHDWLHSGGVPVTEIWMTEAQWAEFVSSFGQGAGVPCTLRHIEGRRLALPPEPEHFTSHFRKEVRATVGKAVAELKGLEAALAEALLPGNKPLGKKALADLLGGVKHAVMQVESNLPYVEDCFDETVEKKLSEAKIEIEGVLAARLRAVGAMAAEARGLMPESPFHIAPALEKK